MSRYGTVLALVCLAFAALSPEGRGVHRVLAGSGNQTRMVVLPATVPRGGRITVVAEGLPLSAQSPAADQFCVYFDSPLGEQPLGRFIPGGPDGSGSPLVTGGRSDTGIGTYQTWAGVSGTFRLDLASCASGTRPRAVRPVAQKRFTIAGTGTVHDLILPANHVWGDTPLGKPLNLTVLDASVARCLFTLPDAPLPLLHLPKPVYIPPGKTAASLIIPAGNPWGVYQLVVTRARVGTCSDIRINGAAVLGSTAWYPGRWSLRMDMGMNASVTTRAVIHLNRMAGPYAHAEPVCLAVWRDGRFVADQTYHAAQVGFDAELSVPVPAGGTDVLTAGLGTCPVSGAPTRAAAYMPVAAAVPGANLPTATVPPTPTPLPTAPVPTLQPPARNAGMRMQFSTYIGGNTAVSGGQLALGKDGKIYLGGFSTVNTHLPPIGTIHHPGSVVITLAPEAKRILAEHRFPGWLAGVAVDPTGNLYTVGYVETQKIHARNAFQTSNHSDCLAHGHRFPCAEVYAMKLSPSGHVLYATYLGGARDDFPAGIAVDGAGDAFIAGTTDSQNFPVKRAMQARYAGPFATNPHELPSGDLGLPFGDAFVTRLDPSGQPVYSTYLGGKDDDVATAVTADSKGNVYVTGWTLSSDLPILHALQRRLAGNACLYGSKEGGTHYRPCADAFVASLDAEGKLRYSTYLGGKLFDNPSGITVDAMGDATVAGSTASPDYPVRHAFQPHYHPGKCPGEDESYPCNDVFLTTLDPDGAHILHSTYFGGSGDDLSRGVAVDGKGDVFVTGSTTSPDLPLRNPLWSSHVGGQCGRGACSDGFVLEVSPDGNLRFSTYLGGDPGGGGLGDDTGAAVAVGGGELYVAGTTDSRNFPLQRALQPRFTGMTDLFLAGMK